ncbi:MAG: hypothetical protein NC489_20000 [Ruminococcus flavefaciens]|nr:hypothetical protein [Ruminococcus flavefaciens]
MANYESTVRTNYFHVKDAEKFRAVMRRVYGYEDTVELWEEKDKAGRIVFGFGAYGGISGILPVLDDENENGEYYDPDSCSYDDFLEALQQCVTDDDAVIILEPGNEKMRYVVGAATIITAKEIRYLDITGLAVEEASKMLGNPGWETVCDY